MRRMTSFLLMVHNDGGRITACNNGDLYPERFRRLFMGKCFLQRKRDESGCPGIKDCP